MSDPAIHASSARAARRRAGLLALGAVVLLCGLAYGAWWLLVGRFHETTDDAYVAGNIVAVTARSGSEDELKARAAGMDGFLRKPITGEQLAGALARIVPGVAAAANTEPA